MSYLQHKTYPYGDCLYRRQIKELDAGPDCSGMVSEISVDVFLRGDRNGY